MAEQQCLFCKIAAGQVKSAVIYNGPEVMAFLDIRPANPGHALVIPKVHVPYLPQLPDELNAKLLQLIKVITQAQIEALGAEGVNVIQNNGAIAGQAVPHIHFHVIPRFKDDKVVLTWDPQTMKEGQAEEIQKRLQEKAAEIASGEAPQEMHRHAEEQKPPPEEKPEEPKKKQKPIKVKPRVP
ncbi:MAG TPA: HIT domain-containing protein [Candidatus Nanoarchaeia archaeon]|nr:HIT domain-containing protein [Candidatus Nanoarchaeia archaeon]